MNTPNITDWMQGIGGVASFIFAIIISIQGKKVKNLTDVVGQLSTSNDLLREQNDMQLAVMRSKLMPVFKMMHNSLGIVGDENQFYAFSIHNYGLECSEIKVRCWNEDIVNGINCEQVYGKGDGVYRIIFRAVKPFELLKFDIEYADNHTNKYFQVVTSKLGILTITVPVNSNIIE